jgi:hypothetical protein
METFLPTSEKVLRNAYPNGVLDHCGLASIANSRELLVRDHTLTISYWYNGVDPFQPDLLHRRDEILTTCEARDAYRGHFRMWGQHMTQARLEGLAVKKETKDYIMPSAKVSPPIYFYPTVALNFLAQNYLPEAFVVYQKCPQESQHGARAALYDKAAIRARESICLLGIFLEHAHEDTMLFEYSLLLERTLFTMIALMPVVHLGMPRNFTEFVRQSIFSITAYFYGQAETMRACFGTLPSCYYDELLECLAELCNLKPRVTPYCREDDDDYLDAAF